MKFSVGDKVIDNYGKDGIIIAFQFFQKEDWYQIDNIGLLNHWVPERCLKLNPMYLREDKLNLLGL